MAQYGKLKKLSFILIHFGVVILILSYIYGLFVCFKYGKKINLEYPLIIFSYFVIGIGLLVRIILTAIARKNLMTDNKKEGILIKIISGVLIFNAFIAVYFIIKKIIQFGYVPFAFFGGTFLFIICFLCGILIYFVRSEKNKVFSLLSVILIFTVDAAAIIFNEPAKRFPDVLNSCWFYIHVTSSIVAYSFLAVSFLAALVFLTQKVELKSYKLIYGLGLFFYFILLVSGSIWAQNAWGSYWNWDPKETWALAAFLVYILGAHIKGKKHYYINILGFCFLLFCYLGVSFFMKGLHSYK